MSGHPQARYQDRTVVVGRRRRAAAHFFDVVRAPGEERPIRLEAQHEVQGLAKRTVSGAWARHVDDLFPKVGRLAGYGLPRFDDRNAREADGFSVTNGRG